MSKTIYKISSYINWRSEGKATGGGGGSPIFPPIDLSQYYTKIELQTAGLSVVNWENITGYPYTYADSIQELNDVINLVGDVANPGPNQYYGTNALGTKGWYALTGGGAGELTPQNNILYWEPANNWYMPYPAKPTGSAGAVGGALYNWYAVRGIPEQPALIGLEITYDDIVNNPYATVEEWNTLFDLPAYGHVFTSMEIVGNTVKLYGGSDIIVKGGLTWAPTEWTTHLISIEDKAECIIEILAWSFYAFQQAVTYSFPVVTVVGDSAFSNTGLYASPAGSTIYMPLLTTAGKNAFSVSAFISFDFPVLLTAGIGCFSSNSYCKYINLPLLEIAGGYCFGANGTASIVLPSLTTIGDGGFFDSPALDSVVLPQLLSMGNYCFQLAENITYISIPKITTIGPTTGEDGVFLNISGNTIDLIIKSGSQTDGDVVYLQANNTVNLTLV